MILRLFLCVLVVAFSCCLPAQDVAGFWSTINTRLKAKDYLRATGRLGAGLQTNAFFSENEAPRRQAPFTWNANAGLTLDFLGIKAPFSASVSSQNTVYNLPSYAFVGLSPTYKWITLHGGDRSMSFSPYSLNGVNYRGAGLELSPGKFKLSAMRGRLRRARIQDAGAIQALGDAPDRTGNGLQLGYEFNGGSQIAASWFHSTDAISTQLIAAQDSLALPQAAPEANQVLTLSGQHRLSDFLSFRAELARSVLTRDRRAAGQSEPPFTTLFGFDANTSTTAASAYQIGIDLSPNFGTLGLQYERINPNYRTHGALYMQSDVENTTVSATVPVSEGKVNLSGNLGVQRNDLDGGKASSFTRLVGSAGVSWQISDRVNADVGFSNFTATNRYKATALTTGFVDSIVVAQTQLSTDATTVILLDAEGTETLLFTTSYQRAARIENDQVDSTGLTTFALFLANYTRQTEGGATLNASLTFHRNDAGGLLLNTLGPALSYGRKIFSDKVSLQISTNYSRVWLAGERDVSGIWQSQLGAGVPLSKSQSVNISATALRSGGRGGQPGFTDLRLGLRYGYTFK